MLVRYAGSAMVRPAREVDSAEIPLSNLSKNPVNLFDFIDIYGNSLILNAPGRTTIIQGFSPHPSTAIAGNCGSNPTEEGC